MKKKVLLYSTVYVEESFTSSTWTDPHRKYIYIAKDASRPRFLRFVVFRFGARTFIVSDRSEVDVGIV